MSSILKIFIRAALAYHRLPRPGKLEIQADQAARQPARPRAGLFAGRRGGLHARSPTIRPKRRR